jgi:rare lipoprotein A
MWLCICALICCSSPLLTACGGPKEARVSVPPPPAVADNESAEATDSHEVSTPGVRDEDVRETPASHGKPLLIETGLASWYGAPYNHHRGSNGEIYNMHAMTAAHRTLPLGSTVRVTNLKTGHSAVVEITDRGPFVTGRILDLSQAAAKKVDVWGAGVAMVRLEVLRAPAALNHGGRWAVQIGAFEKQHAADKFADHLSHRYQTAKVQCFGSPVGDWWVRVRVQDDDRKRAEDVAHNTRTSEGDIFLVRLD